MFKMFKDERSNCEKSGDLDKKFTIAEINVTQKQELKAASMSSVLIMINTASSALIATCETLFIFM